MVKLGWLTVEQPNRKRPVKFTLGNPVKDDPVERARRHIDLAEQKGEAIMREYLTLLVDSTKYQDGARPDCLVNPFTDERMELDRYYEQAKVGFAFNGPQHDQETELGSWEAFLKQAMRDRAKALICQRYQIQLVIVQAPDLSLAGMKAKVGSLLPLRTLTDDDGRLIRLLENKAEGYRAKALPG